MPRFQGSQQARAVRRKGAQRLQCFLCANDVYGEALYREYTNAPSGGPALDAYLKKWPVEFFLITYGSDRTTTFFKYLEESPDWTLVYFDDRSVRYLKSLPKFEPILRRDGYTLIIPAVPGSVEITTAEASRWLQEAERAVAAAPGAWSPLQYKSKALQSLGACRRPRP